MNRIYILINKHYGKLRPKKTKIEEKVVGTYQSIESGVVGTYQKIEDSVVGTYKKIEDKFVKRFLEVDEQEENKTDK